MMGKLAQLASISVKPSLLRVYRGVSDAVGGIGTLVIGVLGIVVVGLDASCF